MQYFVQQNGKKYGPYDDKGIIELRNAGKINRSTLLSSDKVNWTNAGEFEWLYPPPKGQQTAPSKSGSSAGISGKTAGEAYQEYRQAGAKSNAPAENSMLSVLLGLLKLKNLAVGIAGKLIGLAVIIVLIFALYKAAMHFLPNDTVQKFKNEIKEVVK